MDEFISFEDISLNYHDKLSAECGVTLGSQIYDWESEYM